MIEAELAERGQELAFEPADLGPLLGAEPASQTIGGVFAANVVGPAPAEGGGGARPSAGAALRHRPRAGDQDRRPRGEERHRLRSLQAADRLLRHAGRADPGHLQGDAARRGRADPAGDRRGRGRAAGHSCAPASGSPCEISGAAYLPPLAAGRSQVKALRRHARGTAAIRLEGFGPSIAYRKELLQDDCWQRRASSSRAWRARTRPRFGARSATWRLLHPERILWRISVPPAAASELVDWTASLTSERLFDWAGGLIWLAPKDSWAREAETIREALAGRGGHATLMRAPTWLRREVAALRAAAGAPAGADRAGQAQLRPQGRAQSGPDVRRDLTCKPAAGSRFKRPAGHAAPARDPLAHAATLPRPLVPVLPQDPHRAAREVAWWPKWSRSSPGTIPTTCCG